MRNSLTLALTCLVFLFSCKKESTPNNCMLLKDGITSNTIDLVKSSVNQAISQLQNKEHTATNLSLLTTLLSSGCEVSAEVLCFNCIYTNPGQSEIKISLISSGVTLTKVIDITNSASNIMHFVGMHD